MVANLLLSYPMLIYGWIDYQQISHDFRYWFSKICSLAQFIRIYFLVNCATLTFSMRYSSISQTSSPIILFAFLTEDSQHAPLCHVRLFSTWASITITTREIPFKAIIRYTHSCISSCENHHAVLPPHERLPTKAITMIDNATYECSKQWNHHSSLGYHNWCFIELSTFSVLLKKRGLHIFLGQLNIIINHI